MTTVTVDTNGLDSANVLRLQSAARGHDVVFAAVNVSKRELQGSDIRVRVSQLIETAVWDESQWGCLGRAS
jgi:fructose-1,6-bisphosphatase/sedoheptulose 1,7-bisphosphatase-like protein